MQEVTFRLHPFYLKAITSTFGGIHEKDHRREVVFGVGAEGLEPPTSSM